MRDKNIFELIIERVVPADIIYEDERVIAFMDIKPIRQGHFLVVPKIHSENLIDISDDDLAYLIIKAKEIAVEQINKMGVSGFNLNINNSEEAGQEVFHTHIHIIPTKK